MKTPDQPREIKFTPEAAQQLRDLWNIPDGVDEALIAAASSSDPIVSESHLAEARDILTADEDEDA